MKGANEKGTGWFFNRDKVNLDIFWLKDDSLEDSANLPPPDISDGRADTGAWV